ncbi:MAG TPA: glycerol-3-phosphate dehydrogenase/oxidase [Candidatus Binatia bacterium]|nr:glycerol-3-phosphate dehydrogenase/oxidase [Candidatus Binatia bacterium]
MAASPFSPETRAANLESLPHRDLDLLVIGGGITGAGVARDAALRGLSVALIERTDWAAGTSSRSSKLIHGGVRYLEMGDVGLVREAANERIVLRRIAPHLTRPVRLVLPTYGRTTHMKLSLGLRLFETLATVPDDEHYETWTRETALRTVPLLDGARLHGAVVFTEYVTDDARLVLDTVRGAHAAGAWCMNHAEVTELGGERATVRDRLGGRTVAVRARVVVNAAGPWVDEVRRRAGALAGARLHLTKGIHLVVPRARLPVEQIVVMQAADKRSAFAVPRGPVTYLGTTDTDYDAPTDHPEVTAEDADYLLDAANRTFAGPPLRREDVAAAWAGLRPLLHEEGKRPSEISRKDEIMGAENGLVSIAGGKLTTHRRMAERVVDLVVRRLDREAGPCRTEAVPLPNGELPPPELVALEATVAARLGATAAERLVRLYGAGAARLLARIDADPAAGEVLSAEAGVVRAEIDAAIDDGMALTLEDILERRTRLLLFDARQGLGCVDAVAAIAAHRLGWDAARTADEIARYRGLAESLRRFA